ARPPRHGRDRPGRPRSTRALAPVAVRPGAHGRAGHGGRAGTLRPCGRRPGPPAPVRRAWRGTHGVVTRGRPRRAAARGRGGPMTLRLVRHEFADDRTLMMAIGNRTP